MAKPRCRHGVARQGCGICQRIALRSMDAATREDAVGFSGPAEGPKDDSIDRPSPPPPPPPVDVEAVHARLWDKYSDRIVASDRDCDDVGAGLSECITAAVQAGLAARGAEEGPVYRTHLLNKANAARADAAEAEVSQLRARVAELEASLEEWQLDQVATFKEMSARGARVAALEGALRKVREHGVACYCHSMRHDKDCKADEVSEAIDTALSPGLPGKGE